MNDYSNKEIIIPYHENRVLNIDDEFGKVIPYNIITKKFVSDMICFYGWNYENSKMSPNKEYVRLDPPKEFSLDAFDLYEIESETRSNGERYIKLGKKLDVEKVYS